MNAPILNFVYRDRVSNDLVSEKERRDNVNVESVEERMTRRWQLEDDCRAVQISPPHAREEWDPSTHHSHASSVLTHHEAFS